MALFEASYGNLFRRCVVGCSTDVPECPVCANGQVCSLVAQSCDACQTTVCVGNDASASISSNSASSVGGIVGGVVGGIAAIAIITYLVWRFCIKTRRQAYEQEDWVEEEEEDTIAAEKEQAFIQRRDARASTHTVGSVASSVLTRASNVIQIAYIPGVTNRSAPSTPGLLVPPVPPIPLALSDAGSPRFEQEHFFVPGDLNRDSTWSGMSDRTSGYARTSVASTIYGKNAVVSPMPAQTIIRGKASVVSVKGNESSSSAGDLTPPVPSINFERFGGIAPPSPAFSVGSTFLDNAAAATVTKPHIVSLGTPKKAPHLMDEDSGIDGGSPFFSRDSNTATLVDQASPVATPTVQRAQSNLQQGNSVPATIAEEGDSNSKGEPGDVFGDIHEMRD